MLRSTPKTERELFDIFDANEIPASPTFKGASSANVPSLILLEVKRTLRQLLRLLQGENLSVTPLLHESLLPGPRLAGGEVIAAAAAPVAVVVPVAAEVLEAQALNHHIHPF